MNNKITLKTGLVCAHCGGPIGDKGFMRDDAHVVSICCSVECGNQHDPTSFTNGVLRNLIALLKYDPARESTPRNGSTASGGAAPKPQNAASASA